MVLAAQYLRASTDKQRYSSQSQSAAIAAYAAREGLEIIRTYVDEARSGLTIRRRDGLKDLLQDVMDGAPFSTILVLDVSRWGRYQDPDQAAHYEFLCREAGVSVRYCAEPFEDDGSPTMNLLKSMKRVMAAEYSRQLSDRCRAGLRRQALAGGKYGGWPPFGFARQAFELDGTPGRILAGGERHGFNQTVRLVPGPAEHQDTVRLIFRLYVHRAMGPTAIANLLNERGTPFHRPGPWGEARIRCVLRNEAAVGVYAFNRTTMLLGQVKRHPPDKWIRLKLCHPLVPQRLFKAAQSKLKAKVGQIGTDEYMIQQLRRLLAKHGYLSFRLIGRCPNTASVDSYNRRFGSLRAALDMVPYQRPNRPVQRDVFARRPEVTAARLRDLLRDKGRLNPELIRADPGLPSPE